MDFNQIPATKMYPYRKAAWAIEDTQQDIGLIYRQMGRKGLESIQHIDPTFARLLEDIIHDDMKDNDEL